MTQTVAIGVDVGASKVAAGLVDGQGVVRRRLCLPTPHDTGTPGIIRLIVDLCRTLAADSPHPHPPIGVGAPGVIDSRRGLVLAATATMPGWAATALAHDIAQVTGSTVVIDNDVNALALGEQRYGTGPDAGDVLYISVGTSVGGALVLRGRLVPGAHHRAGEIGHFPVVVSGGDICSCGRTGHLETVASGPAMAAAYARSTRRADHPDLREVARLAGNGDAAATAAIGHGAEVLGRHLAGLASVLDPHRVVIGGGVCQIGTGYWTPLRTAFHDSGLPGPPEVDIRPAALGIDAGIVGAAALTHQHPDDRRDR